MRVFLRPHGLLRGLAMAGLLAMAGCGSLPTLGKAEPDSSLRLATIFLSAGAPDAALRAADEALVRRPRNAEAMVLRADALVALERADEAQQAYMAAIAEDPRAVGPRIALGRMLVRRNPAAAEAMFADVLARQPNNAIALNNIGITRDLQGRHREAQPSYRAARTVDPRMTGASVNLGLSLVLSGDMAEAVRELTPLAAAPDASPTVVENLGVALAANGEAAEAARVLARVMAPAEIAEVLAQYRGQPARMAAAPVAAPAPPRAAAPVAAPMAAPVLPPASIPAPSVPIVARVEPASPAVEPASVEPASVVMASVVAPPPMAPVSVPVAPPVVPAAAPQPVVPAAPAPRAQMAAGAGAFAQLAASETASGAPEEWERLRRRLGGLLQARTTLTIPAEVAGRTVWRLRTPFASTAEAASFCAEVRAAGGGCWAAAGS
ncbi:MAG: tetratricopeptide repeat protein [Alphaproteobacteria bacterium]|nr:tetratricopeptide repeat protein [Alphaproteobacteria bacterium]